MTDAVFQEYMRGSRVFILGAGFSAAAGVPLTSDLLRLAMTKFKAECPGIFERVNNYASDVFWKDGNLDYSSASFSELCTYLEFIELREYGGGERWSDDGSREKLACASISPKRLLRILRSEMLSRQSIWTSLGS